MALPETAHHSEKSKDTKLSSDEAFAALEEGWQQYKESVRARSPMKARGLLNQRVVDSPGSPMAAAQNGHENPNSNRKVCILSIDGGGMRGIIPARVLAYLEELLQKKSCNPEARIADFFDITAGTSVGGLISTMLFASDGGGRPLFTGEDAWRLIAEKGKRIFSIPPAKKPFAKLRGILTPRYSAKNMEAVLKEYLVRDGRDLTLKDTLKPVLIPCYDLASAGAFLFSRADALQADSYDFRLWEVCRATSAVPGFFRPAHLSSVDGRTSCTAIDGGLVMNNPTAAAVTHVLHNKVEFPHVRSVGDMLVLSLGTGLFDRSYAHEQVKRWGAFQWAKPVARIVLDGISDVVDHSMSMAFCDYRPNYLRVQVSGIPGRCLTEMDDPSGSNVRRLTKIADEMLGQPCIEHVPFGGKRLLSASNRERLEWFADCLVAEQRARSSSSSTSSSSSSTATTATARRLFDSGNCSPLALHSPCPPPFD